MIALGAGSNHTLREQCIDIQGNDIQGNQAVLTIAVRQRCHDRGATTTAFGGKSYCLDYAGSRGLDP